MDDARIASKVSSIPSLIKRNTLLLSANQAFLTLVGQMVVTFGALAMLKLTGQVALAGLATAIVWGGRVVIVYQSGKWMDKVGRLKVLQIGLILAAIGGVILAVSVAMNSLPGFIIGLIGSGLGLGTTQQNRVAVADMYPSRKRGEGVGYLLTASIIGAIAATPFVALATFAGELLTTDLYATTWLLSLIFLPLASLTLKLVKPDPQEISRNIAKYYPSEELNPNIPGNGSTVTVRSTREYLLFYPVLAAFAVSALVQGNMTMMMSLTSLVMNEHDVHLTLISLAITVHVIGMYGLSVPLGRISDRIGRRKLLLIAAMTSATGSFLTPATSEYWIMTLGIFLVGVGWSAGTVATTALISDLTTHSERGRIIGANDLFLSLASIIFPVLGGIVASAQGFAGLGVLGLLVPIPAVMLAVLLKETAPGVYQHSFVNNQKEPAATQPTNQPD